MANEQNLKPFNTLTEKEQRELAKKGAQKSIEVRRRNKSVKDIFQKLLTTDLSTGQMQQILKQFPGLENDEINYKTAIGIEQIRKAIKGDMNAAKFVFDYAGEKPKEEYETEVKLPVTNITIVDNNELKRKFESYEDNTKTS